MEEVSWLMYASMVVWAGLGGYLFLIGRKASALETRISRLEYASRGTDNTRDNTGGGI